VEEFGPFPRSNLALVEVPTDAAREAGFDGASLDGFVLAIGSYFDQPFNTAFFGHEASHQWWGGLVRRRGLSGAYLLDEALAQFGSLRAVEKVDGPAAAKQYRLRGYPGYYAEYSGSTYLARSLEGIDAPLSNLPLSDGFLSRRVANTKGMFAWNALGLTLGRERFSGFLASFVAEHAYQRVTLDEFMASLTRFAGRDSAFVRQWFETPGAPDISLQWKQGNGRLLIDLRQTGAAFGARVPVEIALSSGEVLKKELLLPGPGAVFDLPLARPVTKVLLDPDYEVLRWTPDLRREAARLRPHTKADLHIYYGRHKEAEAALNKVLASAPAADALGMRFRLLRSLGDTAMSQRKWAEAVPNLCRALKERVRPEEQVPEVWQALAQAWSMAGDEEVAAAATAGAAASILSLRRGTPSADKQPLIAKVCASDPLMKSSAPARAPR
jgi:aminopeptidase N